MCKNIARKISDYLNECENPLLFGSRTGLFEFRINVWEKSQIFMQPLHLKLYNN